MTDDRDPGHALARIDRGAGAARLRFAESLASRKQGEMVLLDNRGKVISGREITRRTRRVYALLGGFVGLGGVAALAGATGGLLAMVWGGGMLGFLLYSKFRYRALRQALVLVCEYRNDEAHAILTAIDAERPRGMYRSEVQRLLATVAWRRGEHAAALAHAEAALAALTPRFRAGMHRWMLIVLQVELTIEVDLERGRALVPLLADAPQTDYFTNERRYIALTLAFLADRPDELPDDETLYDWARAALGENAGGLNLGLLGWAFTRRGDAEMAEHVLGEVRSHLIGLSFEAVEKIAPRLHAWLAPRVEAAEARLAADE